MEEISYFKWAFAFQEDFLDYLLESEEIDRNDLNKIYKEYKFLYDKLCKINENNNYVEVSMIKIGALAKVLLNNLKIKGIIKTFRMYENEMNIEKCNIKEMLEDFVLVLTWFV